MSPPLVHREIRYSKEAVLEIVRAHAEKHWGRGAVVHSVVPKHSTCEGGFSELYDDFSVCVYFSEVAKKLGLEVVE